MGELCLQHGQKFLLIGDSITDCGRRDSAAPFGTGYVALLRDLVLARWPERDITWVNKGIGGNKITDLQERWEDDVMREAPDWLSVKIGINDLHTHLGDPQYGVSPARFRAGYHDILSRTKEKLGARLLLITPFYISIDRSGQSGRSRVLEVLPEYLGIVEEMAQEFGAKLVRLQPVFEVQLQHRPAEEFCPEPVHPNRTGHMVIAHEVLRALCE
jgi:lysophospholipase L1-like esterase